ncbi:retinitis pigmentosa 9 protein homolog isoform X2 [Myxocyprinus asiaticus]|uniref:retinitis pigmentosa 9 protein homolog isoform X2 n=1 Tax=Myxocyprinus asiaticus TaxID=70543 RepID=UPI00222164A8|nr:retinitis pigmentosa 9 protein homolog isoform X2 [Myxocyprinus asiaticus]
MNVKCQIANEAESTMKTDMNERNTRSQNKSYENPPPGLINVCHTEEDNKPEDCIPDDHGNEDARNFLAHEPTKGLWMPLGKEAYEDPMYDIIRENKCSEKETRIQQLKQLLQDTTSDSSSSASSDHIWKRKKEKKKEKRKKQKKKHKAKGSEDSDSD